MRTALCEGNSIIISLMGIPTVHVEGQNDNCEEVSLPAALSKLIFLLFIISNFSLSLRVSQLRRSTFVSLANFNMQNLTVKKATKNIFVDPKGEDKKRLRLPQEMTKKFPLQAQHKLP